MFDLLHGLSKGLEDWSARHEHTVSLVSAVATTAAVIVALTTAYSAKRNSRPHLKARVEVNLILYGDGRSGDEVPTYVTVRLTNTGSVPVRLSSTFFSWGLPFARNAWLIHSPVSSRGDGHVPVYEFPVTLQPWTSINVFLTPIDSFTKEALPAMLGSRSFGRKPFGRLLQGIVYTEHGGRFRATLATSFRKELRKAVAALP